MIANQSLKAANAEPRRVLIVDDDVLQLRALKRAVRGSQDLDVRVASNAIDAIFMIGSFRPDLIIMDIFMPGLDGIEATRRIKAHSTGRDVDIVLASVMLTPELEQLALSAGATRAIAKPVVFELLRSALERAAPQRPAPLERPIAVTSVRVADLLVSMLVEAGVEVMFGIPGGAISPVHDALIDGTLPLITTKHESGAMFAAAGYAQTTGKLGVVAVTSGPGALNAMTGLASAWCDSLPVLLLVGDVPRKAQGRGVLQDSSAHGLRIVELAGHISKFAAEVTQPSTLPHLLRRAISTALSGRRGPVVLTLPIDVMTAKVTPPRVRTRVSLGGLVASETLDEIAELLVTAERPMLLAGAGTRDGDAPDRLRAVAERFDCPVATTPKGKGVFSETHRLSLGVLGLGGHRSARRYLDSGVDVVLAIGTSLGDIASDGFAPALQATRALVHVDIDAGQIGKSYSPTHSVVASAADLLGGLAKHSHRHTTPVRARSHGGIERHVLPSSNMSDRISSHDAVTELQRALPPRTIFTVDSGEHFLFAVHYLEIADPDAFIVMTGLGSMGQSIGAALGAQLAYPDRTVAAICGDGCFAMNAFEIATAVQYQLPIRVFVFNDGRLGMVEHGHNAVYGRRPSYPTGVLDVCSIARGLGATAVRVTGRGQLDAAVFAAPGPIVFDVQIDGDITIPKLDRVAVMSTDERAAPGGRNRPGLRVV